MTQQEIAAALEAILFVAGEALPVKEIAAALDISFLELDAAIRALSDEYDFNRRGFKLMRFDQKVQLATRPEYTPHVEKVLAPARKQTLTQSAMETLAVVAYRQPITRMEIEAIRGVRCERSLLRLTQYGLICEVGRKDVVGRPILYGTTEEFLRHFGIHSLDELPVLRDAENATLDGLQESAVGAPEPEEEGLED